MTFVQSILIALWAGYCSYDDQGPQMLRRPLLIGPIVGIIMGNLPTALVTSATLELMWMGLGNMAGYKTPDMIIGTTVGVAVSISTGQGIAVGVATATTVAILSQQLLVIFDLVRQFFAPWADKLSESGNFDSILRINYLAILIQFLLRAIPTFLVIYFGNSLIEQIVSKLPENVLQGLSAASGILPAIGLSILMTLIMKKGMWPFFFLGFTLATYLELKVLPITLISLAFASIYCWFMDSKSKSGGETAQSDQSTTTTNEEGYDL